ncbi:glycosylphosphatidylinositol anchor biosynthesis [Saxophila tyrrhenica]|uniref:Glycosylphosphatidylinositol anchor biosynthesis n=1 Tax=Saxophila tyrrhenica TaxID=1690608 RepID=A0AAV9NUL3_9PEZI|nr:glycosylphosphatidylinositol anchor biosynthesis [Saxophila tyrrhenica]
MPQHEHTPTADSSRASSIHLGNSHLHPQDAFYAHSPPRQRSLAPSDTATKQSSDGRSRSRRERDRRRGRSSSRRRRSGNALGKGQWKKLLWVKQSYPDNYTDEETFLDHLQRNPRLRPYEFWPLVADSTIIVQHVCSVIIFVCCFTAIFQERVVPQTVVGWATLGTVVGWFLLDYWQTREEAEAAETQDPPPHNGGGEDADRGSNSPVSDAASFGQPFKERHIPLAATASGRASYSHSRNPSLASVGAASSFATSPMFGPGEAHGAALPATPPHVPAWNGPPSSLSPRMQQRLSTVKSAILIYCSLLGLSPILKSLTKSTSSDSIWALSSWLMMLNVMTFDYGAGPEAKFPAPLSTNAALMASTVLASRLPSTTHVFSLTLFSIEVFGLFPVFRRHLRHHSWAGHLSLTTFLVVLASGGLSMTISGGGYLMGIAGVVLGGIVTAGSLGMTTWWLIGLQSPDAHLPCDPHQSISTSPPPSKRPAEHSGGVSGKELIVVCAVGVNVSAGLGASARSGLTFFRPATAGGFGAVAAVGRLIRLSQEQLVQAFGLQYTQTSGTLQPHIEGSASLPLQVGWNSRAVLLACELARPGFQGPRDVFEGTYGYLRLFEGPKQWNMTSSRLVLEGRRWLIAELSHKPFPAGRATHGGVEGLQELMKEETGHLKPEQIEKVTMTGSPVSARRCARPDKPDLSPNYARLCMS